MRKNRKSGGITLYINKSIKFKDVTNMSVVIDNIMECITVQLCTNRQNKFIATCVNRTWS